MCVLWITANRNKGKQENPLVGKTILLNQVKGRRSLSSESPWICVCLYPPFCLQRAAVIAIHRQVLPLVLSEQTHSAQCRLQPSCLTLSFVFTSVLRPGLVISIKHDGRASLQSFPINTDEKQCYTKHKGEKSQRVRSQSKCQIQSQTTWNPVILIRKE